MTPANEHSPQYIDAADVAKMLRKRLKAAFPGTTFQVRTSKYAGGASIDVAWQDGPTVKMVEAITNGYKGGGFDGMIDMAYSVDSWLMPDGYTLAFAATGGTTGSRGTVSAEKTDRPHPQAVRVHSGANYVFCNRHLSPDLWRRGIDRVAFKWKPDNLDPAAIELRTSTYGKFTEGYIDRGADVRIENADEWLSRLVHEELWSYVPASFVTAHATA